MNVGVAHRSVVTFAFALLAATSMAAQPAAMLEPAAAPGAVGRAVAFTFDDLPASRSPSLADMQGITKDLLAHLDEHRIPAIGFVNEAKLARSGEEAQRQALLQAWIDAGHDLGNHTYSHPRLSDTPLAKYQDDVLRGETVSRALMAAKGKTLRYFRHPTLNTGPDLATKRAFEAFLAEHGYVVAPVTVDNDEYMHAAAYDGARARGDKALMERLGQDYIRYMREIFEFYEGLSQRVLGREIPQVLLLHANRLNADYVDELAAELKARGYRFIPLAEALADPAYKQQDDYIGENGVSWIQRWAITRGQAPGEQPAVPDWVTTVYRAALN